MISVGDAVVYQHHICRVKGVRENYYQGEDFLELHALYENDLTLFVKRNAPANASLRPVMSKEEALELLEKINHPENLEPSNIADSTNTSTAANRRIKEEYDKRINSPSPEALLPVLQVTYLRSQKRKDKGRCATSTDKQYYNLARNLLCNELSVSLDTQKENIEKIIDEKVLEAI